MADEPRAKAGEKLDEALDDAALEQEPDTTAGDPSEPHDLGTPREHASEVVAPREKASSGDPDPPPERPEKVERVLIFLNEVAGGRKLLQAARDLKENHGTEYFAVVSPQNQPIVGQIVDTEELREAAQSRVDVTQAVLHDFGIESEAAVLDRDPFLALDDAVRAAKPDWVLLSALYESRYGLTRRDFVEWAKDNLPVPVEHIPVRVDDDAVRWDLVHTLVVATKTVNSRELLDRLLERAREKPHRYTFISPKSGDVSREQVCANLAATLAEMYRNDIDATGQPMSPDPFTAIKNAVEHYRLDEILISTLRGEQSKWLSDGLIEQVKEITDMPIEHVEASAGSSKRAPAAAVGAGS